MGRDQSFVDQRRHKRHAAFVPGWIRLECGRTLPCNIINISMGGARVEVAMSFSIRKCCFEKAHLSFFNSKYLPIYVARQNGSTLGVKFEIERAEKFYIENIVSRIGNVSSLK